MRNRATYILAASILAASAALAPAAEPKPNVLIFLCDDTGWAECGFQGNQDIPTPHIDSIAAGGIRFSQGYVSGPYCSPTRAGLMTGRYQTRFGHEFNSTARESGLSLKETTIADRFRTLGYATCAIGKWHLGSKPEFRPTNSGFDEFYGTLANTPFFHATQFVDSRVSPEPNRVEDPNFYTTDAYGDRAVDWLGKQKDRPWLLYVPFNAQHAPLQAPQKYLDRFKHIKAENRRTFAAMMSAMDDAVGKTLGKVREMGQEENTLIFFLSDNGGPTSSTTSRNDPLRGGKSSTWEGGVRVPFCVQWKGKLPAGKTYEHPIIQLDILPTALAAAGAVVDPAWKLDGVNLLPYLTGENSERPHEALYWRFGNQWAIRHQDWKLVVGAGALQAAALFNLADDPAESKDLAGEMEEKRTELKSLWDKWNAEQAPPSAPKELPANRRRRGNRRQNAPAGRADQPAAAPQAFIDGTGPGWRALGEKDFAAVNCDADTWTWSDGAVQCTGKPVGVIRSQEPYTNFELVAQWRHRRSGGNSGIFVWSPDEALQDLKPGTLPRGGIEVQILDHGYTEQFEQSTGKKADWFTTNGDVFPVGTAKMKPFPPTSPSGERSFPRKELSRGVDQWNHYYIRAINGEVRLWVNGEEVSGGTECNPRTGYLCLESEGAPVEFKDLRIRELP